MRAFDTVEHRIWLVALGLGLLIQAIPRQVAAQSLTSGGLRGTVQSADGAPINGAAVTLENRLGAAVGNLSTDRGGRFQIQLLPPGEYRVLVEQIGFQPLRTTGIVVAPGTTTAVTISLERRPPPITSVSEARDPGARGGGAPGLLIAAGNLNSLERPSDLAGTGRLAPVVVATGDARAGFGLGSGGLPFGQTRLFVDGVLETLLRHPGWRDESPGTPAFSREGLSQVQYLGAAGDLEWRGGPGSLIAAQSRSGGGRLTLSPWGTFSSAGLGKRALDNPGDSGGTSFQLGAVLSGSLVPDTAHIFLEAAYHALEQPSADPWARDSTGFGGVPGSLKTLVPGIGNDTYGANLARYANSTVRTWKGGHGQGRVDWQLGARNRLQARIGFASWKENNPLLGSDLFGGSGSALSARDLSGAAAVTTAGETLANEVRLGVSLARREWSSTAPIGTLLASDGIAFGTSPTLPAIFDVKRVDFSEALQYSLGAHRLKAGGSLGVSTYQQNYRYGSNGLFRFGDLDAFAAGTGTFFQVTGPGGPVRMSLVAPGLFLQDTWAASPDIQIQAGLRFDSQLLPDRRIAADSGWIIASGIPNDSMPRESWSVSPRASFLWNVQNRGEWVLRGSGGLYRGELDPSVLAEAMLFDGAAGVRRGQGTFPNWPAAPDAASAPSAGTRLTLFNPTYRAPRSAKFDVGIARGLRGTTLSLAASYSHTDYLLRRDDLNRPDAGSRRTQEGRPVYGSLVNQRGLVTATPGSNRRFSSHDLVSGLSPTGYVDHYEVTVSLERYAPSGLSYGGAYTYGRTTDNLTGLRQPDPADQLDPFPTGLPSGEDWSIGRSDLDVPHRVSASLGYRTQGRTPLGVSARWRWRSGLPFTPGFRPGVDLNADGGGNNDPVFVDAGLEAALNGAGCTVTAGGFAERNSCREPSAQALDLRLTVGLPFRIASGAGLTLTIDAFNLAGSRTGVVDRAALLIDPAGSITTGPTGAMTVPFVLNSQFGSLLSRRADPRLVRFGVRMEY